MKISQVFRDFKGRKGSQVERRRRRRQERGDKKGGLTDVSCHLQIPLQDFTLGLQRREDWNSALPESRTDQNRTRIETRPEQNQNLSSLPRGGDQPLILSSS